ncbi:hypothetical protein HOD88_02560 [archaeon]|jgi:putative membrane protein|nr:hypothetical protein [archaeon]
MLLEIFLFLILGIFFGTITGLIPGIHINLIGIILISISTKYLYVNPIYSIVFITSMSITHTFVDFIPSIFLGCPDTETELSILPGHKLLKKGHGYAAVILTNKGSIAATILFTVIAFPTILIISTLSPLIEKIIPFILIIISFLLILKEKQKSIALEIFLITGILGLIIFNLNIENSLLPLLTGLFGSPLLIQSIKKRTIIPKQKIINPKIKIKKPILGSLLASPFCSFLPGIGAGQAAIIGNSLIKTNRDGFLILLGATNTFVMCFSFLSLYAINKTRTGSALAIKELSNSLSQELLILVLLTILISGIISFFLTKKLTKMISQKITNFNYTKISITTLSILILVVFFITSLKGVLIFTAATLIGLYSTKYKIRKTNMMGCLLIPTIWIYLS